MLRNYLIIAARNLLRHRLHTAINLAGLSLGLAFCLLAWRFASQEWSFDRFHTNAGRIYRVVTLFQGPEGGPMQTADAIQFAFAAELEALSPHVERTVRLSAARGSDRDDRVVRTTYAGSSRDEEFLLVDPSFLEVFDFPLLRGDASTALADRNSVVLGHEMALRLFGDADPLGQSPDDRLAGHRRCRGLHHHRGGRSGPEHLVDPLQHAAALRQHGASLPRLPRTRGKAPAMPTSCSPPAPNPPTWPPPSRR